MTDKDILQMIADRQAEDREVLHEIRDNQNKHEVRIDRIEQKEATRSKVAWAALTAGIAAGASSIKSMFGN